ncbi:MAG: hypothetical protein SFY32_10345 [Bacteroidota bacterium]|nr:hypothetical protein [Bacteroidota bacterium]
MIINSKKTHVFIFSITHFLIVLSSGQTIKTKDKLDSLCNVKMNLDVNGKLLPRYFPSNTGKAYAQVLQYTAEFIKDRSPIDKQTGKEILYTSCCFLGPHTKKGNEIIQGKSLGGDKTANFDREDWMHNPACVFAGLTQSLALDMYTYTGDRGYVNVVRKMLLYQIKYGTTPASFKWPKVPYASADPKDTIYMGSGYLEHENMRGDGLHGIEPDKIGELGYAYIKFYEITDDTIFLRAALNCADALEKNFRKDVLPNSSPFETTQTSRSPWPFRVNARTGRVIDEYCSHVIEPIKMFEEIVRIQKRIALDTARIRKYTETLNFTWEWLYSKNGPMKTYVWNAYFEDIPSDPKQANRNQVSPMETARFLIKNPTHANDLESDIPALIYYVKSAFGTKNIDAIKEQTWCYEPMASHSSRFASVCAMWYEKTNHPWFKEQAFRHFNYATYVVEPSGATWVGHTWPGSWWSDGYGDFIKHYFDGMAAIPEWAPPGEDHIIKSTSAIRDIKYSSIAISFKTFDNEGSVVARLKAKPKKVTVGNTATTNFTWTPLDKGGVFKLNYTGGNGIEIRF